jgi:O-antigen ligase
MVFFLYLIINALLAGRIESDWGVIKKILLPGLLVLLYLPLQDFSKINKAIIYSSLAAIIFSVVKLIMLINEGQPFNFLESAPLIEAVLIDRLYLGLLCILSILISLRSIKDSYHPDNRYYFINIIINTLFILLIVSRIAIVTLVIIFLLGFIYKIKRGPQFMFATGILLLGFLLAFIFNNDLRKEIFYSNRNIKNQGLVENTLAFEPRVIIWNCAYQLSRYDGTMIKGLGFQNTNDMMEDCYETTIDDASKRNWFLTQRYNTHNQFIDIYLGGGIIALAIMIFGFLTLFVRNRKQFYPTALIITFLTFAMVENVFHRQIGAYYIGFILLSLIIELKSDQKEVLNNE